MSDKPKRRWYQFNLRTMFVGTTLSAVALSFGLYIAAEERQRLAILKVDDLGGSVGLVEAFPEIEKSLPLFITESVPPTWVPTSYFSVAQEVELGYTGTTDDDLRDLQVLTQLKRLALKNTPVTDAGLIHLQGFERLQDLDLSGTQVTDTGLKYLSSLKNLRYLGLPKTRVTDAGVKHLQEALPDVQIHRQYLSLSVDVVEIENAYLEEMGYTLPPRDGFIVLEDVEAFFIRDSMDGNFPEMKFYSRPKVSYPDGRKAEIFHRLPDWKETGNPMKRGAWFCRRVCEFQLTPRISSPQGTVSLTFQFLPADRSEPLGTVTVADGGTVLAFMNSPRQGVQRAVMITPRIIEPEPAP